MMKKILIIGAVIVVCVIAGYLLLLQQAPTQPAKEPKLSYFPEVFKENTVIVIGENASQIEKESAEAIAANLENLTGNRPEIISSKKIEKLKYTYNLIVVGTPKSNEVLEEVYQMTDAVRVTEEYPGDNKGVLEILRNPWNEDKAMLLVEGSDEWGVKAGSEILRYVRALNKGKVVVDWEHLQENKKAVLLGLNQNEFKILDTSVREYFTKKYPFLLNWTDFPIHYERIPELEDKPTVRVVKAEGRFELPSPTATFKFYDEKIELISEGRNK